ncbi:MAG: hypothetical protein K8W52_14165 [Deltaproteobacteria bacterium]|nr:hypothetical protein [Deltaproteobacteria bacterium]
MRAPPSPPGPDRHRALAALDGAIALLVVILIAQMWVLGASLESYLAGHRDSALVGAITSAVLFAGSFGLFLFIRRLDRPAR